MVRPRGTLYDTADVTRFCVDNTPARVSAGGFLAHAGGTWATAGLQFVWYNHALPPNAAAADCDVSPSPRSASMYGVYRATSGHRGGVNVLRLDGSVRFAADGVDPAVWAAAGSRAGGGAVGGVLIREV